MKVYLGTDHRGFKLAEEIYAWLIDNNVAVVNAGPTTLNPNDDYTDSASEVARRVAQVIGNGHEDTRGIVLCGSGVGVDITANKQKGVRSCLGFTEKQVTSARSHDDVNVLALPADYITPEQAKEIIRVFLETPFSGDERHTRRIDKIKQIENS